MGREGNPEILDLIGQRYRIVETLGRGGMAVVYQVEDTSTGQRCALKRLIPNPDADKQRRSIELFEREFHTLAQLSHPRIVAVHDYGLDAGLPYYTMELLDGGDLQQIAPTDWRRACSLGRDLCSALAVLHSRRLVHRDLSPRNVRCTSDGLAKLIDFGGMAKMGSSKQLVGTAAFCAPEVVHLQELDARADLYSLGATLYYTLTGRRAYPARDFRQLRELWRQRPRRPSEFVAGIPLALDELVMELMQLDPAFRPASAAEVMERLSAIAELPIDEHLLVRQAYLTTPTLVGRDQELTRLRKKMTRALRGRGEAVMIVGPSGVGRSRLLDACVLEGKLAGATVLRVDAADAQPGDYGVVRALAAQLLEAVPEAALEAAEPKLAVLGHVVPELLAGGPDRALERFADPQLFRPAVQAALREWLLQLATQRALVITVDDIHRADEPSAAFVALLAHELARHRVLVAASVDTDAAVTSPALQLLLDASTEIELDNLGAESVEKLLASVFGEVPHLQLVAERLHALAQGNPRDVMRLAQHLLDKGLVRYQAGAFSLPSSIDAADLPSSMAQALKVRVDSLSADGRELARAFALSPGQRFRFEDCAILTEHRLPARLLASLDELLAADVIRLAGDAYAIGQQGFIHALTAELAPDQARQLHLRLAAMFEHHSDQQFRVAQHLLHAGEHERGLDVLVVEATRSQDDTDRKAAAFVQLVQSLPSDWLATYELGLALCQRYNRPRRQRCALLGRLAGLMSIMGMAKSSHLLELIEQLHHDSGLDLYASLDPQMEPSARLRRTFELLQERYAGMSEHERVFEAVPAIRQLARATLSATGLVTAGHDYPLWSKLPSLEAYEPLSPALGVAEILREGLGCRITARSAKTRTMYRALLERMAQADRAGLDESHHRYTSYGVMFGLGMLEASMGLESCLAWAAKIEGDPTHEVNAEQMRMLYHLWQGNTQEAERCKRRVEVLRVQNSPRQWFEGTHLLPEVVAYAAIGDLMRVKQTIVAIEALAKRFAGWAPIHSYARAEYQRLRGDHASALAELEAALRTTQAGRHQAWADLAGAHVRTLCELGRYAEAKLCGERYLADAEQQELGYVRNYIHMPLALALARLGEHEAAVRQADAAIAYFAALGSKGLNLGLAYEMRARVASIAKDQAQFERNAALCAEQFRAGANHLLSARYEKLVQDAKQAELGVSPEVAEAAEFTAQTGGSALSHVTSMMELCKGPKERAHCSLELLLKRSGSSEGYLFGINDHRAPSMIAQISKSELPPRIDALARDFLLSETHEEDITRHSDEAGSSFEAPSEWAGEHGERYRPVLLAHPTDEGLAIMALAVMVIQPGVPFVYPAEIAAEVSRFVHDSGDVSVLLTSG